MYICGQKNLLDKINHLVSEDKFPRFSIIVGNSGHGKKVISDYIARQLKANFQPCEIKVESVRDAIINSYIVTEPTLYMFADCDNMSANSKNALLKVTEEPPNNSYFIMTARDINNILPTLTSRGTVFYIDPYTDSDIFDFIQHKNYNFTKDTLSVVKDICVCPQDVISASVIDVLEVYNLAEKFIQFIGAANLGNELKISTMLSTKKDDEKIEPIIFLRCVMLKCSKQLVSDNADYRKLYQIIRTTSTYLSELSKKGCNRQMLVDNWIVSTHMAVTGGQF